MHKCSVINSRILSPQTEQFCLEFYPGTPSGYTVQGRTQDFWLEGPSWRPVKRNSLPNIVMTFSSHHRLRCVTFV